MAKYSCECSDCGRVFDIQATLQEKEEGKGEKFTCPQCQSKNVKPVFSAVNLIKNVFSGDKKECGCSGKDDCCGGAEDKNKEACCSDEDACCCGEDEKGSDNKKGSCNCA